MMLQSFIAKSILFVIKNAFQTDTMRQAPNLIQRSVCYDFNESPGIYIFVDDSNIWIGAKALQSKLRRFKTVEDHRLRIDIGKLTDVLADGRSVDQGVLYGSEPPPVDSVWNKIKEQGWRVMTDKKSKLTGKEKKVDTRLVAEVTALSICTRIEMRTTIVLVTGDADVIPAMQEAMKQAHWSVEVCMWKHAMSRDLSRFARDNDDCEFLDDVLERQGNKGGIVFSIGEKAFCGGGDFHKHIPTQSWLLSMAEPTREHSSVAISILLV